VCVCYAALASSALPCSLTPRGAHGCMALGCKAGVCVAFLPHASLMPCLPASRHAPGLPASRHAPHTRNLDRTGLAGCMRNVHAYFPRGLPSGQAGRELVPGPPQTSAAAAQPCTIDAEANMPQHHDAPPAAPTCAESSRWPSDLNTLNLEVGL
jgi:hypothetical protein